MVVEKLRNGGMPLQMGRLYHIASLCALCSQYYLRVQVTYADFILALKYHPRRVAFYDVIHKSTPRKCNKCVTV